MNDPNSLSDNNTTKTGGGFLFDDWNTFEERSQTESSVLFDGKIIARMPDLGSEGICKGLEKPKFPQYFRNIHLLVSVFRQYSAETRQRIFHRIIAIGGIVLLCGTVILLFSHSKDETNERVIDMPAVLAEKTESSTTEPVALISESAFLPIASPESSNVMSDVAAYSSIPVAPVERFAAISPPSPWDRPVTDAHSSRETPQKQPENPFQSLDATTIDTVPAVPSDTAVMSPMYPLGTMSLPVSPYEMPVSPYEMQRVAQANIPPNHPVIPTNMMPMQERRNNIPDSSVQYHAVPMNSHASQFGQPPPSQYVVPPNYLASPQQQAPQSVPIPSGVSTLNQQPMQPYHGMPYNIPVQNSVTHPPGSFYNEPPNFQRLF